MITALKSLADAEFDNLSLSFSRSPCIALAYCDARSTSSVVKLSNAPGRVERWWMAPSVCWKVLLEHSPSRTLMRRLSVSGDRSGRVFGVLISLTGAAGVIDGSAGGAVAGSAGAAAASDGAAAEKSEGQLKLTEAKRAYLGHHRPL